MYATNFEYDGKYLSDFGFIICTFDGSSGVDTIDSGAKLSFNTVPIRGGRKHFLTSVQYDDCITSTFSICKDPENTSQEDMEITSEEFRSIARWLNRPTFNKFSLVENDIEYTQCYYNATFNVSRIEVAGTLYGIEVEMVTDSPFGYGRKEEIVLNFKSGGEKEILSLRDKSDEIGYLFPTVKIQFNTGVTGDDVFSLQNTINENIICSTKFKHCAKQEEITIDGDTHMILTTISNHTLAKDFNYDYFKIGNTISSNENKITASHPCTVIISYHPVIKRLL